jgi:hypothetical protein
MRTSEEEHVGVVLVGVVFLVEASSKFIYL